MTAIIHPVRFVVGARQLLSVPRRVGSVSFSLQEMLRDDDVQWPALNADMAGLRVLSVARSRMPALLAAYPKLISGPMQYYPRHYIEMTGSYADYLAQFSGKTRSTLMRKQRRFAELSGGALDVRAYRSAEELGTFLEHALPLSAKTYQARSLDAGLPQDSAAQAGIIAAARADGVRAFILFCDGVPVSYLYLPVAEGVLVYDQLGYHPDYAQHSPGTVLQMAALEALFAEPRFTHFDFTEGDGAHKRLFATHSLDAASLLLLRPTWSNRALLGAQRAFDAGVDGARRIAAAGGLDSRLRGALKRI